MRSDPLHLAPVPRAIWENYLESPGGASLPRALRRCWDRVRRLGAPHTGLGVEPVLDDLALRERRERLEPLLRDFNEVVEPALKDFSDRHHLLVFADRDGVVLSTAAGGQFADVAREVRLIEGSSWGESMRGTNAIGTAIAERRPVTVQGAAHFAMPNHALSCHAAPIRGPKGEILAVLDATSVLDVHPGFVNLAVLSLARLIEQRAAQRQAPPPKRRLIVPLGPRRPASQPDPVNRLAGEDPRMRALRTQAKLLAPSDLPLLLLAETGTGKGTLAKGLHEASHRARGPFIAVNCGAVNAQLLESELFGYAPGAFTGASAKGSEGYLAAADGGTLFLDEVAEMSPALQVALLRFLDDGHYNRVGDSRTRHADVRVICATCRDLPALIASRDFRADLFYRIQGATLRIPPLRERNDRLSLAGRLLAEEAERCGRDTPELSSGAQRLIMGHDWPGNVRQLKSALQYALVMSQGAAVLEPAHFPEGAVEAPASPREPVSWENAEREALEAALRAAGGNVSEAARTLGVSRSTVYRMMGRHGLR